MLRESEETTQYMHQVGYSGCQINQDAKEFGDSFIGAATGLRHAKNISKRMIFAVPFI